MVNLFVTATSHAFKSFNQKSIYIHLRWLNVVMISVTIRLTLLGSKAMHIPQAEAPNGPGNLKGLRVTHVHA